MLEFCFDDMSIFIGEVSSMLLVVRYGLQLHRIYRMVKQARDVHMIRGMGEIDLNDIDMSEEFSRREPKGQ